MNDANAKQLAAVLTEIADLRAQHLALVTQMNVAEERRNALIAAIADSVTGEGKPRTAAFRIGGKCVVVQRNPMAGATVELVDIVDVK